MEAFLTTLPPYVHDFINKYPATDVFNLLRELICFAVLYNEDRERLNQSTKEFLQKREENKLESVEEEETKDDGLVPESKEIKSPTIETQNETVTKTEEKPNMPNTFPEWWGHHEFEPSKTTQKEVEKKENEVKDLPPSYGPAWVSWENQQQQQTPNKINRMERAKSQIIPDLRSYLEEDHTRMTTSLTSPSNSAASKKRHSALNIKTSSSPTIPSGKTKITTTKTTDSPLNESPASKFVQTANKQQTLRAINNLKTNANISSPSKSASANIKQPRQNAAMRARAEHARLQQEELERKKNTPPPGSSISLKIKQRANSGIDWESIKQERRRTITEQPKKD